MAKALELFGSHGYEGVSIADLTSAIGIAPPSLYAAFGSKAALFDEALDRYTREHQARTAGALAQASSLDDWVRALILDAIDAVLETGTACLVSTGLLQCAAEHQELVQSVARRRADMLSAMEAGLAQWLSAEASEQAARFLAAVLQGISVQARDGANRNALISIGNFAIQAVRAQCEGMLTSGAGSSGKVA